MHGVNFMTVQKFLFRSGVGAVKQKLPAPEPVLELTVLKTLLRSRNH